MTRQTPKVMRRLTYFPKINRRTSKIYLAALQNKQRDIGDTVIVVPKVPLFKFAGGHRNQLQKKVSVQIGTPAVLRFGSESIPVEAIGRVGSTSAFASNRQCQYWRRSGLCKPNGPNIH
jgi:hypothetical protein